jgi:NAD(P)H-dependent FMN reductase
MTEQLPGQRSLLIVWHSRTGAAQQMAQAAQRGAQQVLRELNAQNRVQIVVLGAEQVSTSQLVGADAYLFCAPENLGSLSGTMKEFFDRTYYGALNKLNGRPAAIMIAAGSDGQGAARQTERICTGWRLRLAIPTMVVNTHAQTEQQIMAVKQLAAEQLAACAETGGTLAALLA